MTRQCQLLTERAGYGLFIFCCIAGLLFVLAFADEIDRWGERDLNPKTTEVRK